MKVKIVDNNNTRCRTYYKEYTNKKSKYKGVYLNPALKKKPWIVKICIKMKYFHVGSYKTELEAAAAYDSAISVLQITKQIVSPQLNGDEFPEVLNVEFGVRDLERLNIRLQKLEELFKVK